MDDTGTRFPPLYITAWVLLGIGVSGLLCLLILRPPPHIFSGLLYIFLGCIAFGIGEIVNHPKTSMPKTYSDDRPQKFDRRRNSCSLGNLSDIGAVLLFFVGLSALLFPQ